MTQMKQIFTDKKQEKICVNPYNPCHLRAEKKGERK